MQKCDFPHRKLGLPESGDGREVRGSVNAFSLFLQLHFSFYSLYYHHEDNHLNHLPCNHHFHGQAFRPADVQEQQNRRETDCLPWCFHYKGYIHPGEHIAPCHVFMHDAYYDCGPSCACPSQWFSPCCLSSNNNKTQKALLENSPPLCPCRGTFPETSQKPHSSCLFLLGVIGKSCLDEKRGYHQNYFSITKPTIKYLVTNQKRGVTLSFFGKHHRRL